MHIPAVLGVSRDFTLNVLMYRESCNQYKAVQTAPDQLPELMTNSLHRFELFPLLLLYYVIQIRNTNRAPYELPCILITDWEVWCLTSVRQSALRRMKEPDCVDSAKWKINFVMKCSLNTFHAESHQRGCRGTFVREDMPGRCNVHSNSRLRRTSCFMNPQSQLLTLFVFA